MMLRIANLKEGRWSVPMRWEVLRKDLPWGAV